MNINESYQESIYIPIHRNNYFRRVYWYKGLSDWTCNLSYKDVWIYNAKGKVVEKNAMFERSYTFSESVNSYLYGGQKDDPTRFDLGKKQTIILNYVEVNGR